MSRNSRHREIDRRKTDSATVSVTREEQLRGPAGEGNKAKTVSISGVAFRGRRPIAQAYTTVVAMLDLLSRQQTVETSQIARIRSPETVKLRIGVPLLNLQYPCFREW